MAKLLSGTRIYGNATIDGNTTIAGNVNITSNTASTSATTGALTVRGGVGIGGNLNVGSNYFITGSTVPYAAPILLNDVSTQVDGVKSVFLLAQNQNNINTITESKDLEVYVNGRRLDPYVTTYTYPWITPFDTFVGFKVVNQPSSASAAVSEGKVVIYNSPFVGQSISLTVTRTGTTGQVRRYPYSATTIALGD
jgi:hypothetical protein